MKIIYVVKDILHRYPPCISQIVMLREQSVDVIVVTEMCDEETTKMLTALDVKIELLGNFKARANNLERVLRLFKFKNNAIRLLKKIYKDDDIIWIGTERTGIMLYGFLKNKTVILNDLELNDANWLYKMGVGRCLKHTNAVVACEKNRARIMQTWYSVKKRPFVMPNKPYYELKCKKSTEVEVFEKKLLKKKYILYQGILDKERPLDTIADALNKTKEHYTFVIIGKGKSDESDNEYIEKLRGIYPDIIYGGYFPAPQHLYVTQNAYMGIAIYDTSSLNTLFCAPNKTFEYAKFGVPVLGSDIPGLQLTVEKYNAGICVDIEEPIQIAKAIDDIAENYEKYQVGAKVFYDSVDNRKVMKEILKEVGL